MNDDLHDAARQLLAARTEQSVRHTAVRTFANLSGADRCEVVQPGEDGCLRTAASVVFGARATGTPGPLETHRPILEHSFEHSTAGLIDDLADVRSASAEPTPSVDVATDSYRSLLAVPIEEHGLLVATDRGTGHFSGTDLESMKRLAELVAASLDRFTWDRAGGSRLEAVARVISHDVQNAIGVANGRLELAMDGDRDQLPEVEAAHQRLLALTDDLVTVLRTGDSVTTIEPVALAEQVDRAWSAIDAPEPTLAMAHEPRVMADATSLCQLLENLFRNAVDHGGASVRVEVGSPDDTAGFYVADDGPGIPQDERESVFEMGYTTGSDNTGYGLSIVERIADAHGWDVTVAASADGGARFDIRDVEPA